MKDVLGSSLGMTCCGVLASLAGETVLERGGGFWSRGFLPTGHLHGHQNKWSIIAGQSKKTKSLIVLLSMVSLLESDTLELPKCNAVFFYRIPTKLAMAGLSLNWSRTDI